MLFYVNYFLKMKMIKYKKLLSEIYFLIIFLVIHGNR